MRTILESKLKCRGYQFCGVIRAVQQVYSLREPHDFQSRSQSIKRCYNFEYSTGYVSILKIKPLAVPPMASIGHAEVAGSLPALPHVATSLTLRHLYFGNFLAWSQ